MLTSSLGQAIEEDCSRGRKKGRAAQLGNVMG